MRRLALALMLIALVLASARAGSSSSGWTSSRAPCDTRGRQHRSAAAHGVAPRRASELDRACGRSGDAQICGTHARRVDRPAQCRVRVRLVPQLGRRSWVIRLSDGTLVAHWLQKSGADTYAYDLRMSRSTDDGKTWTPSFLPHTDRTKTEHGFASLLEMPGTGLALVWLDGRAMTSGTRDTPGGDVAPVRRLRSQVASRNRRPPSILASASVVRRRWLSRPTDRSSRTVIAARKKSAICTSRASRTESGRTRARFIRTTGGSTPAR